MPGSVRTPLITPVLSDVLESGPVNELNESVNKHSDNLLRCDML